MTIYYLGKTKAGQLVKRASTRNDYTHASVEMMSYDWHTKRHHDRVHGPVVDLGACHFSTSAEGAHKLAYHPQCEIVQLMKVDAKVYRATIKDAERV